MINENEDTVPAPNKYHWAECVLSPRFSMFVPAFSLKIFNKYNLLNSTIFPFYTLYSPSSIEFHLSLKIFLYNAL